MRTGAGSGQQPWHSEGADARKWVLYDFVDVVVHIFTEEKRAYYALDGLWGDATRLDVEDLAGREITDSP